jgi:hypothetical protein
MLGYMPAPTEFIGQIGGAHEALIRKREQVEAKHNRRRQPRA